MKKIAKKSPTLCDRCVINSGIAVLILETIFIGICE